jgi:hypothetical protein
MVMGRIGGWRSKKISETRDAQGWGHGIESRYQKELGTEKRRMNIPFHKTVLKAFTNAQEHCSQTLKSGLDL